MKKVILNLSVLFLILSCSRAELKPIETFGGGKYVVSNINFTISNSVNLQLKNRDTIFWATVLYFDGEKIKVGDTIK